MNNPAHRKLIILDLEATCDDNNTFPRNEMETIEIGAKILDIDHGFTILSAFSLFIKPNRNPVLTDFCKELTGISQEQVNAAGGFVSAFNQFKKWTGEFENIVAWGSWGRYDQNQLKRDCKYFEIENFLSPIQHLDISNLYCETMDTTTRNLYKAVHDQKLLCVGNQHRALDDASNVILVIQNSRKLKETILNQVQ
ncbi:3'-5' exonuclease [Photobacterium damselae]|uniref:3'-5' exonuclease n=1 Tax=Photobacterium damselae TaxID=38293 RepID=UPI001F3976DF|nr:3'-5' exonuclease [Photobacterium damselae]UKA05025.1 exonuclease domain-containing protein [Photobacterium damselae subsp. damselae]